MARVLVVDDDPTVREVVATYLRAHDHVVEELGDGEAALVAMSARPVDLVVLDLMLPGIDGLEVCRRMRTGPDAAASVPVIMLTARGEEEDRIAGLEVGADDYLGKPFSPRELALRVDSVLRRVTGTGAELPDTVADGDLELDHPRRSVTRRGAPLPLTGREYDLLRFLVTHPGATYSREDLLEQVWGWTVGDKSTVTVHVRRVREKVEADPTRPTRLLTVWGVGYRWEAS